MATRIEYSNNIVDRQSIAYIRPINLTMVLSGVKPNTQVYVYFDKTNVTHHCSLDNSPIYSDVNGNQTITLRIPGGTFTTGVKEIIISDTDNYSYIDAAGSVYGSAKASFTSTGVAEIYQATQTTVNTETVVIETIVYEQPVVVRDPLAQSFFTYGVTDGMFITSIGLYFKTKDDTLPVRVELREMVNGYPSPLSKNDSDLICSLNPSQVLTSDNATLETKFTFPIPVYLEENKDYCFVVFSNSNKYNIFTSKIGEPSIENGKIIYTQPYVGSLFKSENNITWTAEQTEDIKFNIYKAEFDTTALGDLNLKTTSTPLAVSGKYFTTTAGSKKIIAKFPQQHGLDTTSYVTVQGQANCVYNGIASSALTGNFIVKSVIDEYTFTFEATANATQDGIIETGGQLTKIFVDTAGSGYETDCKVKIGTTEVGTCVVSNGKILDVRITNTNITPLLTTNPTLSITTLTGSGAILTPEIEAMFTVATNKPVNFIFSNVPNTTYNNTRILPTIKTTKLNYVGGNLQTYEPSDITDSTIEPNGKINFKNNSLIASEYNTNQILSGVSSMLMRYELFSTNKNISPVVDLRNNPSVTAYSYRLRNQTNEDTLSDVPSGQVDSVQILANGSGYTVAPTVTFSGGGSSDQATATAILGTSSVSNIVITNGGSGYTSAPVLSFSGGGGSGATATAILNSVGVQTATVLANGSGYEPSTGDLPVINFVGGGGGVGAVGSAVFTATSLQDAFVVTAGGSGYTVAPTVNIVGGGGSGATAMAIVAGGQIISITLTDGGSGYTTVPSISFTGSGTGAQASCKLSATTISGVNIVTPGSGYTITPTFTVTGSGGTGASGTTTLLPRIVSSISITNPGTNYTTAPTISFNNTGTGGTGAAATAAIAGKSISDIIITTNGSGYTFLPDVLITRNGVGETGVDAIALPKLSSINTEIGATGGSNISRYISKRIALNVVSKGITLISSIYSETESNVDWYIRTSISTAENHKTLAWKKLKCSVERNLSVAPNDYRDYTFTLTDIDPFDTYDLKCVLRSSNPAKAPIVQNYRVIISA